MMEQRLRVRNGHSKAMTLTLEPWGDTYQLAPDDVYDIIIHSPGIGIFDVEMNDDSIIVWGWEGAYVSLIQDGRVMRDGTVGHLPVPRIPFNADRST